MTRKDYHLRSATGAVMRTFDDGNAALKYAESIRHDFPGVHVVEVVTTVTETVLYRARMSPKLRLVA
jgi:hypothetical protein